MGKTVGHDVTCPAATSDNPSVTIPVPEELETVPGIPKCAEEVEWYSREYPLESHNVENRASRQWGDTIKEV